MKRVAVLTSGGDAPGMNAATRAVVRAGVARGFEMFGVRRGYAGLIAGEFQPLGPRDVGGIIHLGGTMLGTSRCIEFKSDAGQQEALHQLQKQHVSSLVVIGGNGSQSGAFALASRGMRVIGIASTIDNDVPDVDVSIGSTTALDIALEAVDRLRTTAAAVERAFLVEVMGRDSGYLALMTAIAGGAEAVVIPEVATHPETLASQLRAARLRGKSHAIVVVAEGAKYDAQALDQYFSEHSGRLGFDLRVTRLGHVQRGGAPNVFDRLIASELGAAAIERIAAGEHGLMLGITGGAVQALPLSPAVTSRKALDMRLVGLAKVLEQ
jgi:6-phosphofructokinase 1